ITLPDYKLDASLQGENLQINILQPLMEEKIPADGTISLDLNMKGHATKWQDWQISTTVKIQQLMVQDNLVGDVSLTLMPNNSTHALNLEIASTPGEFTTAGSIDFANSTFSLEYNFNSSSGQELDASLAGTAKGTVVAEP